MTKFKATLFFFLFLVFSSSLFAQSELDSAFLAEEQDAERFNLLRTSTSLGVGTASLVYGKAQAAVLGAGVGFLGEFFIGRSNGNTIGSSTAYRSGAVLGLLHGAAIQGLFPYSEYIYQENISKNSAMAMGALLEGQIWRLIAGKQDKNNHELALANSTAVWGYAYAGVLRSDAPVQGRCVAELLGSAGGWLVGYKLGQSISEVGYVAEGDVVVYNLQGIMGGFVGAGVGAIFQYDNERYEELPIVQIGAVAGHGLGLLLGYRDIKKNDYKIGKARRMVLTSSLIGIGSAALLGSIEGGEGGSFIGFAVGAIGSYAILKNIGNNEAHPRSKSLEKKKIGAKWNFDFNPLALQKIAKNQQGMPLLHLSCRF